MPEEFENWALLLQLGFQSTLIRRNVHQKRSFSKTLFKMEEFENGAMRFSVDVTIIRWFVCPRLPQTQIQNGSRNGRNNKAVSHAGSTKTLLYVCSWVHSYVSATCDCCIFKFLWRSVDGKHSIHFLVWTKNNWCIFRVKPPFLHCSSIV